MSVDTQQPAPVRFPSPPVASTSSHPADPRLARLPRAPPKKPNPHKPDSALWVMPDGTLAIGAEAKALTRTAVELPLLWARVGDGSRWARREREEGKGKLKVRLDEFRIVIGYGQEGEEGIEVGELGVEPGVFVAAGVDIRQFTDGREGSQSQLTVRASFAGQVDDLLLAIDTRHASGFAMENVEAVKSRLRRWHIEYRWNFEPAISELYATPIPPEGESIMPIPPKPANFDPTDPATWTPKFAPITQAEVRAAWAAEKKRLDDIKAAEAAAQKAAVLAALEAGEQPGNSPPAKKRRAPARKAAVKATATLLVGEGEEEVVVEEVEVKVEEDGAREGEVRDAGQGKKKRVKKAPAVAKEEDDDGPVITAADFTLVRPRRAAAAARSYAPDGIPSEAFADDDEGDYRPASKPSSSKPPARSPAAARTTPRVVADRTLSDLPLEPPHAPYPALSPELVAPPKSRGGRKRKASDASASASVSGSPEAERKGSMARGGRPSNLTLMGRLEAMEVAQEEERRRGEEERRLEREARARLEGEVVALREEGVRRESEQAATVGRLVAVKAEVAEIKEKVAKARAAEKPVVVEKEAVSALEEVVELRGLVQQLEARLAVIEAAEAERERARQAVQQAEAARSQRIAELGAEMAEIDAEGEGMPGGDAAVVGAWRERFNRVAAELNELRGVAAPKGGK